MSIDFFIYCFTAVLSVAQLKSYNYKLRYRSRLRIIRFSFDFSDTESTCYDHALFRSVYSEYLSFKYLHENREDYSLNNNGFFFFFITIKLKLLSERSDLEFITKPPLGRARQELKRLLNVKPGLYKDARFYIYIL